MFRVAPLFLILLCLSNALIAAPAGVGKPIVTIEFAPISEMSGLVKSQRFEDVYWVHNDSGDAARLFAVNGEGKVIFPAFLKGDFYGETPQPNKKEWPGLPVYAASNVDWEDIAVDGDYLYVADMGNNGNSRRDLGIFVIPEPDPRQVEATRALKFIPVRYPDQANWPAKQWHFDSESLFIDRGKPYIITKHRQPGKISDWESGAVLYRLDTMATDEVNVLTRVDANPAVQVATAADLSPDGRHLVVLGYTQLWIFDRPPEGDAWLSYPSRKLDLSVSVTHQAEAVAFADNDTVIIGNEERQWFRVKVADIPAL